LSSLFPRPGLDAPQELTDDHGYPGFIYFSPQPATRADERSWLFSSSENCSVLIESRRPLKRIALQLENHSPREALHLTVAEFDGTPVRRQLPAMGNDRVLLQQLPYKKVKNRYFYQLRVQGKFPAAAAVPTWLLRVHFR